MSKNKCFFIVPLKTTHSKTSLLLTHPLHPPPRSAPDIVNKLCVARKASYYSGQSHGSFHENYNNLTSLLHCFSCNWLIFSLHFLSQSRQRVFSALPRFELNSFTSMLELKKVITLEWIEVEKSFHNTRQRYCTAVIRQVFILPRWKFASTNQKHYLVLGSDTSSVWNLCTRFPDVISRSGENQWWRHEMLVVFSGKKGYCFTISSPRTLFLTLYQGSTLAWRSTVLNSKWGYLGKL